MKKEKIYTKKEIQDLSKALVLEYAWFRNKPDVALRLLKMHKNKMIFITQKLDNEFKKAIDYGN